MKRIAFANIKGGTGKTTLANELAFSLDRSGIPYSYFDMDGQRGGAHVQTERDDAAITIADTAGSFEVSDLETIARAADVVVIPTRSSGLDVYAFSETLQTVREANPDAKVIIVQNGWNRYNLARDYAEWLTNHGEGMTILQLPQSEAVAQAATHKLSVLELSKRSSGAKAMRVIVDVIREAAGLAKEHV